MFNGGSSIALNIIDYMGRWLLEALSREFREGLAYGIMELFYGYDLVLMKEF